MFQNPDADGVSNVIGVKGASESMQLKAVNEWKGLISTWLWLLATNALEPMLQMAELQLREQNKLFSVL